MKFCQGTNVDDPRADLKGQGHRSKVKVTKKCDFSLTGQSFKYCSHSHRFPWSRSKVIGIKVKGHLAQGHL